MNIRLLLTIAPFMLSSFAQGQALAIGSGVSSWQPTGDVARLMTPSLAVRADLAILPTGRVGIEVGSFLVSGMNAHRASRTTLTGASLAIAFRHSHGDVGLAILPTVSLDALALMDVPGPDVVRGSSFGVRGRADWRFARPFRVFAEVGGSRFMPTPAGQRSIELAATRPSCFGTCVPQMSGFFSYTFTTGLQILLF